MCVWQNRGVMLEMEELCACKENRGSLVITLTLFSVSWSSSVIVFNMTCLHDFHI